MVNLYESRILVDFGTCKEYGQGSLSVPFPECHLLFIMAMLKFLFGAAAVLLKCSPLASPTIVGFLYTLETLDNCPTFSVFISCEILWHLRVPSNG